MKDTYLVKFDVGSCGETYGVLITAVSYSEAKLKAERIARERHTTHYGVHGTMQVDADWRNL
jgi:hypothetical protein